MRNLSDEDIEALRTVLQAGTDAAAEKGAKKAIDELEQRIILQVGRTVLRRLFWLLGTMALAAAIWAVNEGWIK